MYVNPGELDKPIEIVLVSEGEETNKNGFPVKTETLIRKCFAKVTNTSGAEIQKANSEFSDAKKRFLVRWTPAEVNTDMVVRYGGKDHDIVYVNPYGDGREYLEIWTELSERV